MSFQAAVYLVRFTGYWPCAVSFLGIAYLLSRQATARLNPVPFAHLTFSITVRVVRSIREHNIFFGYGLDRPIQIRRVSQSACEALRLGSLIIDLDSSTLYEPIALRRHRRLRRWRIPRPDNRFWLKSIIQSRQHLIGNHNPSRAKIVFQVL